MTQPSATRAGSQEARGAVQEWMLARVAAGVLALPRDQVHSVEHAESLLPGDHGVAPSGWLDKPSEPWPVYSFDGKLEFRARPASERFAVFVIAGENGVGFTCERVSLLPSSVELRSYTPGVCLDDDGPVRALGLLYGEEIVLITSGPALTSHVERLSPSRESSCSDEQLLLDSEPPE